MSKEKWLIEVVVGDKTYQFEYETRKVALFDVDELLYGTVEDWVHIQDTYFKVKDIKMVSYRKIKQGE